MKKLKTSIILLSIIVVVLFGLRAFFPLFKYGIGDPIDSLNGVPVYYNRSMSNISGRNTIDGYNLGLKYQCVEFVKRYYYVHLNHKMPNSYGHAISFFDINLKDGAYNIERDLTQFTNPSISKPMVNDLIIMGHSKFGHVAIISEVTTDEIEIIQQNSGMNGSTRKRFKLTFLNNSWTIEKERILGWLRKST